MLNSLQRRRTQSQHMILISYFLKLEPGSKAIATFLPEAKEEDCTHCRFIVHRCSLANKAVELLLKYTGNAELVNWFKIAYENKQSLLFTGLMIDV